MAGVMFLSWYELHYLPYYYHRRWEKWLEAHPDAYKTDRPCPECKEDDARNINRDVICNEESPLLHWSRCRTCGHIWTKEPAWVT